jgi:putative Ca2+/H+ antiporter (TMEM165/GDT1 family)
MDWKIFWTTFITIFLAEIGDKTQLGVVGFSAEGRSPLTVFLGASCALIAATLIGVLAGSALSRFINPKVLHIGAGVLFIVLGLWMLLKPGD